MGKSRFYGIDLGTTYSCIAQVDNLGKPIVLQNAEGEATTPSVVYFESKDNVVVGQAAKEVVSIYPDLCVSWVKRVMGDTHWEREFYGEVYRPQDIASFILRKLVDDAAKITGEKIEDVVITCPAYFGVNEKEATQQAGILAGLNVRSILLEPTAAALAYGIDQDQDQVILVYDLGGGTFDVTVVEIKGNEIRVICTGGDHQLGGRDWDDAIVLYLTQKFEEATGTPVDTLLEDQETHQDLLNSAERCKKLLSSRQSVTEAVRFGGERVKVILTRGAFDLFTAPYLERTLILTDREIEKAREKGYNKVDKLLLVGGSTYMPQVIEAVRKRFPFKIRQFDPNQAVAKGAALFAYKRYLTEQIAKPIVEPIEDTTNQDHLDNSSEPAVEEAQRALGAKFDLSLPNLKAIVNKKISSLTSRSFGVVTRDHNGREVVRNLIFREDPVPILRSFLFETLEEELPQIQLRLMENQDNATEVELERCMELGMAVLYFQQPLPRASKVEVNLSLSPDGLLTITGQEFTTGREVKTAFMTDAVVKSIESAEKPVTIRNQVFVSYSHRDRKWLDELLTMLSPVLRKGTFSIWEDSRIQPGMKWREEIEHALASAKVAVLLVSKEFLASGFIMDNKLPDLLKAARAQGLKIIWVLLKPCLYAETEVCDFQAAHDLAKPLAALRGAAREAVLAEICRVIKETVQDAGPSLVVA